MKKGGFDQPCMVYFIQVRGGGPIKIGATDHTGRRLKNLKGWCPLPLDIVCEISSTYFAEAFLHNMQKPFRIHGEWFNPNAALDKIMAHISEHGAFPDDVALELESLWEIRASEKRRNLQNLATPKGAR